MSMVIEISHISTSIFPFCAKYMLTHQSCRLKEGGDEKDDESAEGMYNCQEEGGTRATMMAPSTPNPEQKGHEW
jgi:hypothetical protein